MDRSAARRVVSYRHAPAVSGDLFPWKVRITVYHGPTMLISGHSTEDGARTEADLLQRDHGAAVRALDRAVSHAA